MGETGKNEKELLKEWEEKIDGKEEMVILHIVEKSEITCYNAKTTALLIWFVPPELCTGEDDVKNIVIDVVSCGMYESYNCQQLIEAAKEYGWYIVKFPSAGIKS